MYSIAERIELLQEQEIPIDMKQVIAEATFDAKELLVRQNGTHLRAWSYKAWTNAIDKLIHTRLH